MGLRPWIVTIVPIIGMAYIASRFRPQHVGAMEITGAVLALVGLTLLTVARLQLGDSFSVRPQARHLVTTGLYSRIRNPIYLFGVIGLSGLALYFERPVLLLLLLVLVPLQIRRAKAEERVLTEKFGDEYVRYKAQTWF